MTKKVKARAKKNKDQLPQLPVELHEKIISFIPAPDRVRFRTVSRRWRDLIAESALEATLKSPPTYLLICVDKHDISGDKPRTGNEVCYGISDTETKKCYCVETGFVHRTPSRPHHNERYASRLTLAADKGLICVLLQFLGVDNTIYVENPLTRSWSELPCFNRTTSFGYYTLNLCVVLDVADNMSHFRIFVLQEATPGGFSILEKNRFSTFDSRVGRWRDLAQPPISRSLRQIHMLKVGNILYTVFLTLPPRQPCTCYPYDVYAYDIDQDAWSYTGMRVDGSYQIPQLVTWSGRVFLTAWKIQKVPIVTIWETAMTESMDGCSWTSWEVARCSGGDVAGLVPLYANAYGSNLHPGGNHLGSSRSNVLTLASRDGRIVFTSATGLVIAYRLATKKWIPMAPDGWAYFFDVELRPELEHREGIPRRLRSCMLSGNRVGLFASLMKLTLCAVPVVATPANNAV